MFSLYLENTYVSGWHVNYSCSQKINKRLNQACGVLPRFVAQAVISTCTVLYGCKIVNPQPL